MIRRQHPNNPIVITGPKGTRVFQPDGQVTHYWADGTVTTTTVPVKVLDTSFTPNTPRFVKPPKD